MKLNSKFLVETLSQKIQLKPSEKNQLMTIFNIISDKNGVLQNLLNQFFFMLLPNTISLSLKKPNQVKNVIPSQKLKVKYDIDFLPKNGTLIHIIDKGENVFLCQFSNVEIYSFWHVKFSENKVPISTLVWKKDQRDLRPLQSIENLF